MRRFHDTVKASSSGASANRKAHLGHSNNQASRGLRKGPSTTQRQEQQQYSSTATIKKGNYNGQRTQRPSRDSSEPDSAPNLLVNGGSASPQLDGQTSEWTGGYIANLRHSLDWTASDDTARSNSNRGPAGASSSGRASVPPVVVTQIPAHLRRSVLRNAMLLIDKPPEWTSCECLRALKWSLKMERIGHSGSLDAMGTGLVLVMTGDATRLTPALAELEREYSGVIRLGTATDTYDRTGKVTNEMPWKQITDEMIEDAVEGLSGEIFQVPPFYSNIKYKGKPLYEYAQRGQFIELPARPAYVKAFSIQREPGSRDLRFYLIVAKGTYVRSIAHELGKVLGSCAHLAELRREAIGGFKAADAWTIDTLVPLIRKYRPGFRDG